MQAMHQNLVPTPVPACARRLRLATLGLAAVFLLGGFDLMETWRASNHRYLPLGAAWRFHLGDAPGAQAPAFNDGAWPSVDVPHDWSIAGPRASWHRPDSKHSRYAASWSKQLARKTAPTSSRRLAFSFIRTPP